MRTIYKVSSIVYRFILILVIPVSFLGNILTAAAGHNRDFGWFDYLLFFYLIATVALLTLYNNIGKEYSRGTAALFFAVETLILISIILELYKLYDTFFVCKCFTTGDNISTMLLSIFLVVSIVVFCGLYKEWRELLKRN